MKKIDYKLKRLVTGRDRPLEWKKTAYEIDKFNPALYDDQGIYRGEDWEEWKEGKGFYDIGKVIGGHLVTAEEYLSVEDRFVSTAIGVMKASGCKDMTVVFWGGKIKPYLKKALRDNLLGNNDLELQKAVSHLRSGDKVPVEKTDAILRLALRRRIDFFLLNLTCQVQVNVGYAYFLVVHTPLPVDTLRQIVSSHDLFLEPKEEEQEISDFRPKFEDGICLSTDERFRQEIKEMLDDFMSWEEHLTLTSEHIDTLYREIPISRWIPLALEIFDIVEACVKEGNYPYTVFLFIYLHDVKRKNSWQGRNVLTTADIKNRRTVSPEIFLTKDPNLVVDVSVRSFKPVELVSPAFDGHVLYCEEYDAFSKNFERKLMFHRQLLPAAAKDSVDEK